MSKRIRVVMYVTRVTGYVLAEVKALAKRADVTVLDEPSNISREMHECAPEVKWIDLSVCNSLPKIVAELSNPVPDVYLCAGWARPFPNVIAKFLKAHGCITIVGVDTPWRGDFRQRAHMLISRFTLKRKYDYGWAAGLSQQKHLYKLGYDAGHVKIGFYSADVERFCKIANLGHVDTPHVFLYVGRYAPVKNMHRMESAFLRACEQCPQSDWRMVCIGGGELWDARTVHKRIAHLGYKTPVELQNYIQGCGCAVVPSVYEPWGVVVHEFAAAALPILCSNRVNSSERFVRDGVNGYLFDPYEEGDLTNKFVKIMNATPHELHQMRKASSELGNAYTPDLWAESLLDFSKRG